MAMWNEVVGLALKPSCDRFQHQLGVVAPTTLNLIQLAAINADGLSQLRLGKSAVSAPLTDVVGGRRMLSIHFLGNPNL